MALTKLDHPFKAPVQVTQPFGPTDLPFEPMGFYYPDLAVDYYVGGGLPAQRLHCGVDYALPEGTEILAPAPAKVLVAGWSPTGFGERVILDHGDILTLYGHFHQEHGALGSFLVRSGQLLKRGQLVGHSGNTGNSSGPHLHWSVLDGPLWRRLGRAVYLDPARYLYGW